MMRLLVTGGTGVIGEGLIPALLEANHTIRLLSRGAERDARQWPQEGVEPFAADVTDAASLRGAAADCDAVIHITGIVDESPPELTFQRVNVRGTKNMLMEAARSGVKRFLYISSLGAERGSSRYHKSKFKAEEAVRASQSDWLILRPGNVYGPGDEVISTLLKLIRTLPAVPVIDGGDQKFQPIWYADLGQAIVRALAKPRLKHRTLELAGTELTDTNDVIDRLAAITGRQVTRINVPAPLASLGVQLAGLMNVEEVVGMKVPLSDAKLRMLLEENVVEPARANALTKTLGVASTPFDEGLRLLADMLPEQLPTDGVGPLEHKRFWADIEKSRYTPVELLEAFRDRCAEVMPLEFSAEKGAPQVVEEGVTLTLKVPARGNVQVRVEEVAPQRITFSTVEGHMLAGAVQFKTAGRKNKAVRFTVEINARAANRVDLVMMKTLGDTLQKSNWREVVERVVELSGGTSPEGVKSETLELDDDEARRTEGELAELVDSRKRAENGSLKSAKKGAAKQARKTGARKSVTKRKGRASSGRAKKSVSVREAGDNIISKAFDAVSSLAESMMEATESTLKTANSQSGARRKRKAGR
jgi:uncharacterized protein YbjT (DUF2867 family)